MNNQDDKKDQIFTVHKGSQNKSGNSSILDKRSFNDFECRESGLSLDNIQDKKPNKKDDKVNKKMDQKYNMVEQNIPLPNTNYGSNEEMAKQKKIQDMQQEYDQQNFKYVNEGFTVQSNYFIKKMASDESASKYACKYPLYKMIRSIVKKFLFNELEIIFFAYFIEKNNWQVDDENLRKSAFYLKDFLNITEVNEPLDYKSVLLYLVLNAYMVKYYLNDQQTLEMFKYHVESIVPKFKELFSYWSKKCSSSTLKIDTKQLNKVFKKISAKPTDNKSKVEDYNSLVDAIIQISPPYNNEKNENNNKDNNNNNQLQAHKIKTEENLSNSQQHMAPTLSQPHNNNSQANSNAAKSQNQQKQSQQSQQNSQEPQLSKMMSSKMFAPFPDMLAPDNNFPNDFILKKNESLPANFMDTMFTINKQDSQQPNLLGQDLGLVKQQSMQSDDGLDSLINKQINQNTNNNANNNSTQIFQNLMNDSKQFPLLSLMQTSNNFDFANMFNNTQQYFQMAQSMNQNNMNNTIQNNQVPIIPKTKNKKTDIIQKQNSSHDLNNNNTQEKNQSNNNNTSQQNNSNAKNNSNEDDDDENLPEPQINKIFSSSIFINNEQ